MVRLNPIPWLFAPGVALVGWFVDGLAGAAQWLAAWAVLVTAATLWVVVRRRLGARDEPDEPGS